MFTPSVSNNQLNTVLDIYEAVSKTVPNAELKLLNIDPVTIEINLKSRQITLTKAVDKTAFINAIQAIFSRKISAGAASEEPPPSTDFLLQQPLIGWKEFRRTMHEQAGNACTDLIIEFLSDPDNTETLELEFLGLSPEDIGKKSVEITDWKYFAMLPTHILTMNPRKQMRIKDRTRTYYPAVFARLKQDHPSWNIRERTKPLFRGPKTWPNIHSVFTAATLVNNIACLIFPQHSWLFQMNIAIRGASIASAIYRQNKIKGACEVLSLASIFGFKSFAIASLIDVTFETINAYRCQRTRQDVSAFKSRWFPGSNDPSFEIPLPQRPDPTIRSNALQLFKVLPNAPVDLDAIKKQADQWVMRHRDKQLGVSLELADVLQRRINYIETAYYTLSDLHLDR